MKTISILIPTYNEEENIALLYKAIVKEFLDNLPNYVYEIVFIDNCSKDNTRQEIQKICAEDKNVKAIFNAKNFGQMNSPYYGICQTTGDCTIAMCADFQDPIEMIHKFVREWENGYRIVIGIKSKSKENKLMYLLRSIYYKLIRKYSDVEQIEHFTGFGLYDRAFVDVLRKLEDPMPYLRGIVAELGFERKEIEYVQAKRLHGKSKNNFYTLYDAAMLGFTSYTKILMRLATMLGFVISVLSFLVGLVYLILKLIFWSNFPAGMAPIVIGFFFIGAIQLLFIGLLGEYILNINLRVMKRPLVVEDRRINFDEDKQL
ncbi:MAG: glycosyltransferase [Clostridiales bacterium]|jgi:glycosyltransferase involved in cell wall biosynthesis|nr:glycosyltransferase [Clostridiales bacterium]